MDETKDYLTVDEPISGQNYVCISFISPETLIQEKVHSMLLNFFSHILIV